MGEMTYLRGRWPEDEVPSDEPLWLHYEVDWHLDAVLRTIDVFEDGRVERNSIALQQRNGRYISSLVDISAREAFADAPVTEISSDTFEALWVQAADAPH